MILENLKDQGVIGVHKFTRKINQKDVATGLILLTFNRYKLPEEVTIAWYSLKTREFFPNPMRCKRCQKLGHTMKRCINAESCDGCNLPPHPNQNCIRTLCANCLGEHQSSSKECPRYLQQKEILKIQTQNKCSFAEARRIHKQLNPFDTTTRATYASTLTNHQTKNNRKEATTTIKNNKTEIKATNYSADVNNSTSSGTIDKMLKLHNSDTNPILETTDNNEFNDVFDTRANIHLSNSSPTSCESISSMNSSPISFSHTSEHMTVDAQNWNIDNCPSKKNLFKTLPSLNSVLKKYTQQDMDSE